MDNNRPDVTISVVNTNNRRLLEPCLKSIYEKWAGRCTMELIVVDNASTDGSVEMVQSQFPEAKLIVNEKRKGFGANHNSALRIGQGRYFLVLNDDTVMLNDTIEQMIEFADAHPRAGMVGPKTFNPDGTLQDTCVRFPTVMMQLKQIFFQRFSDYCVISYPPSVHDTEADVEWLRGSAMLVRREAMEEVGMLDERFFIFYEEVDWCYRMRKAGWRNLLCPQAHMIHVGKQTVSGPKNRNMVMDAQMFLSELLYFDKHYPFSGGPIWRLFHACYICLRMLKTWIPGSREDAEDRAYKRGLLRHMMKLTLNSPRRLVEVAKFPGGIVRA